MKIKADPIKQLHKFREREMQLIFERCHEEMFGCGLELGAGDGFQTQLLKRYVSSLVCTELNERRLERISLGGLKYCICDAEKISEYFEPKTFDIVFSSNLLEHLPNVQSCLSGIHSVLKDDGISIHLMPNPIWKFCHLIFFYPNLALTILEHIFTYESYIKLIERSKKKQLGANSYCGDNIKVKNEKSWIVGKLWPQPHGAYCSNFVEFKMFSKTRWVTEFAKGGFEVVNVTTSPFSSGYRVGLESLRSLIEKLGIGTEYIYISIKKGNDSSYVKHFSRR